MRGKKPTVVVYLGMSADGFIAKLDDDVSFTYDSHSFDNFKAMAKQIGVIVVGRRTFELGVEGGNFPLQGVKTLVLTSDPSKIPNRWGDAVSVTDVQPRRLFAQLARTGFTKVLVGGGAGIVAELLRNKLVDELYLDIIPVTLGAGKSPFPQDKQLRMALRSHTRMRNGVLKVHYELR